MQGYLIHHGIKGQRWGVRRYQNEDGTLTRAGTRRQQIVNKQTTKINILSNERANILKSKGGMTSQYMKKSYDLLAEKGKLKIAEGKLENDSTKKLIGKSMLRESKMLRRPDSYISVGYTFKDKLYPSSLSKNDKIAADYIKEKEYLNSYKRKKAAKTAVPILTIAALTTAITIGKTKCKYGSNISFKDMAAKSNLISLGKNIVGNIFNTFSPIRFEGVR